jgi:branched-chain amino acid transport system substrate-binding protein
VTRALFIIILAAVPTLSACGTDQSRGGRVPGDTLTVYTSLPLQGPHREQAQSIVNAEKLALKQAGGKAGEFKVNFAMRDDSTAGDSRAAGWNPGRTADNASKAAEDAGTIAYIGEFDSGATAVSIPITNEAGFVQVGPASTAVGLTKLLPGADKGEPEKYYPGGDRTFARLVPADDVQAAAAARWARQIGARKLFVLDDKTVWGEGLAEQFARAAARAGLRVVGRNGMDPRSPDYRELGGKVRDKRPDLVYFAGGVESNAVRLWRDLHSAVATARLMGPDRLLVPDFYRRLGPAAGVTYLTSVTKDLSRLDAQGRRFVRDYRRQFGERPDPYAAYGYSAMSLLLDAIGRAGNSAKKRQKVIDEVFATRDFKSPVGTFSVNPSGDTTLDSISAYRVRGDRLSFVEEL